MKQIRKRLTYANVMSSIAVFLVLGGASAFAATQLAKNSVGSTQLKKNAVTAAKIKNNAVTSGKIKNNAVTGAKIANGAVTSGKIGASAVGTGQLAEGGVGTGKLADGAVNSGKLAAGSVNASKLVESERSEVFATTASSEFDLVDTFNPTTWSTVLSLNLPAGNWVIQSSVGFAVGNASTVRIGCRLNQGGKVLAIGGTQGENLGIILGLEGISLAGIATGGQVTLTCGDNANGVSAIQRSLIATRAGTLVGG